MGKNVYSSETKWAVVKAKKAGESTTNEIMEKYGIKNKSQISTWVSLTTRFSFLGECAVATSKT